MDRSFYLDLAAAGLRMPIGTHLVLHGHPDHAAILRDGRRLGTVVEESAARFRTPLAVPLMDLTLEKEALLAAMGVPHDQIESHHFDKPPGAQPGFAPTPRMRATCDAISHVASRPGLLPMGMGIGPFSLMTKLVADPITAVFLAGTGATAADEPEVALAEAAIDAGIHLIEAYLHAQIDAGAKAIIICEPAANQVYFSPNQLAESYTTFDRFVTEPMRRLKNLLDSRGVDLIFHDCGELTDSMVERFATLDPAILSLGSSRSLPADAAIVPKRVVLYGNLPTKRFISPALTTTEVARLARELLESMHATGHPFILGSECDVLSVPGLEADILAKVDALLNLA
jgi:uroporphyrinogen-III decarboxylase